MKDTKSINWEQRAAHAERELRDAQRELALARHAWTQIEAEFLPALGHHYNENDEQRFLTPMRNALKERRR